MGNRVPERVTPLSESDIARFLYAGYRQLFGVEPSADEMAGAWAQVAIETSHGKRMKNYNFGNIATSGAGPDYYALEVDERVGRNPDVWKTIALKFVSFDNALSGARGYWSVLASRFSPALDLFRQGEFLEAAQKLSQMNYFSAPLESSGYRHIAELAGHYKTDVEPQVNFDSLRKVLFTEPGTIRTEPSWPLWLGLAGVGAFVGWRVFEGARRRELAEERRSRADRELAEELDAVFP